MDTKQLYPVEDGKAVEERDGVMGVLYAGMFVPVLMIEGQLFTELDFDGAAKAQNAKFPGWDWDESDTAASADAKPWPPAPSPGTRTHAMALAAGKGGAELLSNSKPLELETEDDDRLRAEIEEELARQKAAESTEG